MLISYFLLFENDFKKYRVTKDERCLMEQDINKVINWSHKNKMILNISTSNV